MSKRASAKYEANKPDTGVRVRGLTWQDLPGRDVFNKRLNLALMKSGEYPPKTWRVPPGLEGPALAEMLHEKAKKSVVPRKNSHGKLQVTPHPALAQAVAAGVPHGEPQPNPWPALERILRRQADSGRRIVVRVTRITTQPLDPDNHSGSVKALLDCIRQAFPSLVPDDSPEIIDLQLQQVRCDHENEQGTLVEIWGA